MMMTGCGQAYHSEAAPASADNEIVLAAFDDFQNETSVGRVPIEAGTEGVPATSSQIRPIVQMITTGRGAMPC